MVRYICAGYHPQEIRFPSGLKVTCYMSDGRPLPKPVSMQKVRGISGERYDLIIEATTAGTYTIPIDIKDWVTGKVWGTARTRITVT